MPKIGTGEQPEGLPLKSVEEFHEEVVEVILKCTCGEYPEGLASVTKVIRSYSVIKDYESIDNGESWEEVDSWYDKYSLESDVEDQDIYCKRCESNAHPDDFEEKILHEEVTFETLEESSEVLAVA